MRRGVAITGLALAAMLVLRAQAPADPLAEQRRALTAATRESAAALARSQALDEAAATARDAAAAARARLAAVAARVERAQADITAAQARITIVERQLERERRLLADRQAPTARLVAALQSLARRPAVAALAQPGTTADLVHVRAALDSVIPVVAARTAGVRTAIERTGRLRADAARAARSLADGRAALERERIALARTEAESRLRSTALSRTALVESDRAIALGEDARDIVDQMALAGVTADTRVALEQLAGPLPRPGDAAASAASGIPPYRMPVAGEIVTGLGEVSDSGVRARGLTLATWQGAPVVAPAAGRIVFARRFRGYAVVVIVDHGDGWTTLLSGLEAASVAAGDRVAPGTPIGRAGAGGRPRITVELRRRGVPIDLVPLLA